MKKLTEGRGKTLVSMDHLTISVNGMMLVSYEMPFFVDVSYYAEPYIPATEDEPACEEYVEALSIKLVNPMYLSNGQGVTMSIDSRCELLGLLSFSQIESIEAGIGKEPTGCVHYAEPIRSKLCASDNLRLPEDEAIKTALGHQLLKTYERS